MTCEGESRGVRSAEERLSGEKSGDCGYEPVSEGSDVSSVFVVPEEMEMEFEELELEVEEKLRSSGGGWGFVRPLPVLPVLGGDGDAGSGELRLSVRSSCSTC